MVAQEINELIDARIMLAAAMPADLSLRSFFLCKRGFQNYFSTARVVVLFFPCFPWSRALSHKFRKSARKSAAKTEQSVPSRKFP